MKVESFQNPTGKWSMETGKVFYLLSNDPVFRAFTLSILYLRGLEFMFHPPEEVQKVSEGTLS